MEIYLVKQGDSVDSIAALFGVPAESVIYNNQLTSPYKLAIGQALLVPAGAEPEVRRPVWSGGYAYPSIERTTLQDTLPWLSDMRVFSYGFTPDGTILSPTPDDSFMLELAHQYNVRPVLCLTPIDESGTFNNLLIHQVINDPARTQVLIENLITIVQEKGFEGVDVDFEYILAVDREPYVDFIQKVRDAVNAIGYEVSVALAPKTSADQPGLLYEGKDYAGLGMAANHVLLMTYEWGYTYGPPMAVAPLDQVRRVVEYAVSEITPEKINLGIPNYGYDWTLPFTPGFSRATALSLQQAVELAIDNDAAIEFDPVAMSPHFNYNKDGVMHEVWFEDVRSLREKFGLITEYGLRGAVYWQLMSFFRPNWILLEDTFRIERG